MQDTKPLSFSATPLDYFILSIISIVCVYIPVVGWAFVFNYSAGWFAERTLVNGKKVRYQAGFGESLVFLLKGVLLMIITLGIYSFWFYPKAYRYLADHVSYDDAAPEAVASAPAAMPVAPQAPDAPVVPTPPAAPIG